MELMEMENSLNTDCQHLLFRIKGSNTRSFSQKTKLQQQNEQRLKSLSIRRRKLNHSLMMKRQFSLTGGISKIGIQGQQMYPKKLQKVNQWEDNYQICQPQFNLRKGSKIPNMPTFIRKPFSNIGNINRIKLTLTKQNEQNSAKIFQQRMKLVNKCLQVNTLIGKSSTNNTGVKNNFDNFNKLNQDEQNDSAVQNANTVNQIFMFIKGKSQSQNEQIGQFTQIIFKLVCYFFVSFVHQADTKIRFDSIKMMEFVQRQIQQSYSALNSFKRSRKDNGSKQKIKSNQTIFNEDQNYKPQTIRKNKKVSSFFKVVDPTELEVNNQKDKEGSLASLRKYNRNMASQIHQFIPIEQSNNLNIYQNNNNDRRISIAINSIQEDHDEHSQNSASNQSQAQNSNRYMDSNSLSKKAGFRSPNTRRKSCFLTEMTEKDLKFQKGPISSKENQFQAKKSLTNIKSPIESKNSLFKIQVLSSENQIQTKFLGSDVKLDRKQSMISNQMLNIKQKQNHGSKTKLNLSTPYDFLKQDNLITKRRKYLQLHQKITEMEDTVEQLKKQDQQLTEKIQQKDSQLIQTQNKLLQISQQIQLFQARAKQAEQFLNGPQCPQMVQKIIRKNVQLKRNLTGLINSQAWQTSNLSQSSNVQHILSTKQNSLDKLNLITRKLRGCKDLEGIDSLVSQMRQAFLITIQKYSEIIDQFQDKIKQSEEARSNMLKNLQDWQMQNRIKQKLVNNSFLDYYSVERKVTTYIQKIPDYLKKLQQYVYILSQQRKPDYIVGPQPANVNKAQSNKIGSNEKIVNDTNLKKIMIIQKQIFNFLEKMIAQNGSMVVELPKQKKFAMVLEKIV